MQLKDALQHPGSCFICRKNMSPSTTEWPLIDRRIDRSVLLSLDDLLAEDWRVYSANGDLLSGAMR